MLVDSVDFMMMRGYMLVRDDTPGCLAVSRLLDAYGASRFKRLSIFMRSSYLLDAYGASRFKRRLSVI